VFSPRHRISKQLSLSPKKGLLFTFGIWFEFYFIQS
jgi:hypothetical protein